MSRRTTVIQDLLVRRQFSLVPDNRTNVNVEACLGKLNFFQLGGGGMGEEGYQSSGTVPNEGHKDTTGKFGVGSVNLFNICV